MCIKPLSCQRLPFDWRNPFGYFIAMVIEYAIASYAMTLGALTVATGVGAYLYMIASSKCIKVSLFSIGRRATTIYDDDQTHRTLDHFVEFIQFHSFVKQLSTNPFLLFLNALKRTHDNIEHLFEPTFVEWFIHCVRFIGDFVDIYQHFFTILFVWSLSSMCGALLMIQIQLVQYYFVFLIFNAMTNECV